MSNSNMFDGNAVYPITDEYNFISEDDVIPEQTTNPVFEPFRLRSGREENLSFDEPLLSMSDNM